LPISPETGCLKVAWSTTGLAWQPTGDHPEASFLAGHPVSTPGWFPAASSGAAHSGTLRSPSFHTPTPQIHLRVNSDQITARVVTENYHMGLFSRAPFSGTIRSKDETSTSGTYRWISLDGNLDKYIGLTSYLEFIDHGNGHATIDEIRLSKGPRPPEEFPAVLDALLAEDEAPANANDLASRLDGASGGKSLVSGTEKATSADAETVDWFLGQNLIPAAQATDFRAVVAQGSASAAKLPRPSSTAKLAPRDTTKPDQSPSTRQSQQSRSGSLQPLHRGARWSPRHPSAIYAEIRSPPVDDPLTARVMVSRLWHHLFGRGIVPTGTTDSRRLGTSAQSSGIARELALPATPMEHGWSIKHSIREIVLSATYAQAFTPHRNSTPNSSPPPIPPTRFCIERRCDASPRSRFAMLILAVSGRLDLASSGPSIPTYRNEFMTGRGGGPSGPLDGAGRRTVYLSDLPQFPQSDAPHLRHAQSLRSQGPARDVERSCPSTRFAQRSFCFSIRPLLGRRTTRLVPAAAAARNALRRHVGTRHWNGSRCRRSTRASKRFGKPRSRDTKAMPTAPGPMSLTCFLTRRIFSTSNRTPPIIAIASPPRDQPPGDAPSVRHGLWRRGLERLATRRARSRHTSRPEPR